MEINSVNGRLSGVLVGIVLVASAAGCASAGQGRAPARQAGAAAGAPSPAVRGTVVSVTPLARMSQAQTGRYLDEADLKAPRPRAGVDVYRLVYRTVSATGRPTTASGVVALPRGTARALQAVSFAHGTHSGRRTAGSVAADGQSRIAAVYYAAAGYAGVAPDYLGLGVGPGAHPYLDAASEGEASLDMLRAARTVAVREGARLDRRVLVTGFSQGGQAAMALGRRLERGDDPYLRLGALAPVSGVYDLRRSQIPASLPGRGSLDPRVSAFNLAYATVAWNRLYRLYGTPSELFRAPYAGVVEQLFDGSHDEEEVFPRLPARLEELLTPRYVKWLERPSGALLRAIRAADGTCDWEPRAPVRLYGAAGDEQVTFANTGACVRALRRHGAVPRVVDYGPGTRHFDTLHRGLPDTLRWFQTRK